MKFVEVAKFIGECFSEEFVVILGRGNILREDCLLLEPVVYILRVEPIVGALMFHDLNDSTSVDLSDIFIMKQFVQRGSKSLIFLLPFDLVFE
jgi:hypothetical protein